MKASQNSLVLTVMIAVGFLFGCAEEGPPLGEVSGQVTLDGKPLEGAAVIFMPKAEATDAGTSNGKTDEEGYYELNFGRSRQGAYLGEHTVLIEHTDYFKGNHTAVVKAGENTLDFKLSGGKETLPQDEPDDAVAIPVAE